MDLPIVFASLLLEEIHPQPLCFEITGDAEGVRMMGFFQSVSDAGVLCQIAIGVSNLNLRALRLKTIKERPSHDPHKSGITKNLSALLLQCDLSVVVRLMTRLTERDEVVRGITAGFSAFEMMDIQNRILGFPMAMTTLVAVTAENILSDVPEAELITLLVIRAFNVRVLDLLDVEGRGFHNDLCHRKAFPNIVHAG